MFDLSGKRAVVSGGGSGIGRAIARGLASAGASVAVFDLDRDGSTATAEAILRAGGQAMSAVVDSSSESAVEAFATSVDNELGGIDIWVNNAGRLLVQPFLDMTSTEWKGLLDVNLNGYYYGARAAARRMTIAGCGRIINVTSVTRQQASTGLSAYITGKAAVEGLTRALALELGGSGITVNAVAPGATRTGMTVDAYTPAVAQEYEQRTAVGFIAEPEDVASAAVFLASDEARYVTGHEILVDGGLLINGNVGLAKNS